MISKDKNQKGHIKTSLESTPSSDQEHCLVTWNFELKVKQALTFAAALWSAPAERRVFTTSLWPNRAAMKSEVAPSCQKSVKIRERERENKWVFEWVSILHDLIISHPNRSKLFTRTMTHSFLSLETTIESVLSSTPVIFSSEPAEPLYLISLPEMAPVRIMRLPTQPTDNQKQNRGSFRGSDPSSWFPKTKPKGTHQTSLESTPSSDQVHCLVTWNFKHKVKQALTFWAALWSAPAERRVFTTSLWPLQAAM